jgi:hypothetical protein
MLPKIFFYYTELVELSKTRTDLEPKRLAKAYTIVELKTPINTVYETTVHRCNCKDSAYRSIQYICKHRLVLLLKERLKNGYPRQGEKVVKIGYETRVGEVILAFGSYVDVLFGNDSEACDLAELVLA